MLARALLPCASPPSAGNIGERQCFTYPLLMIAACCLAVCCAASCLAAVKPAGSIGERQWYTDYAKMSFSALLFYGYVFGLGLALYFALRWFK